LIRISVRLWGAFIRQSRAPGRWWTGLEPAERVLYRAIAFLGPGTALVWPPLGLIVPGLLFALVFFGFSFRRTG
jgi:hypothetical protein